MGTQNLWKIWEDFFEVLRDQKILGKFYKKKIDTILNLGKIVYVKENFLPFVKGWKTGQHPNVHLSGHRFVLLSKVHMYAIMHHHRQIRSVTV